VDSNEDALAETVNRLHLAGMIHRQTRGRSQEAVDPATLERVSGFIYHRLLDPTGHVPRAQFAANHCRQPADSSISA